MRSLIIGATGCGGSHLADYLLNKGSEVFGTKRKTSSLENLKHILDKIKTFDIALNDQKSIVKVLSECRPDQIYFFASAKHFDTIKSICETNIEGTWLFFDALLELPYRPRIVLISSSAVYGAGKDSHPISEKTALLPAGDYALAKVLQEKIAGYYYLNHNMDVVIARPFNHPGPRENPGLVCTDFARQIVDIEINAKEPVIKVGNLEAKRDFTDVRDIVRGYVLLAEKGREGEIYNFCSGKAYSVKMILHKLISMSTSKIDVEVDPEKLRSKEIDVQTGDNSKISSETGWKPEIPLEKTLEDILIYNRKAAGK